MKKNTFFIHRLLTVWLPAIALAAVNAAAAGTPGYYRFPAIHGDTVVFTAEGDLWRTGVKGGVAQRLTSHSGEEFRAAFSPDGKTLSFTAQYEGAPEIYTMPVEGGLPKRMTYEGEAIMNCGWTPDGKILYATRSFSTLPDWQMAVLDPQTGFSQLLPLSQAGDGVFDPGGKIFYFTRQWFQGSHTKRYQGGTAQSIWRFATNAPEAVPLTADYPGTSKQPMYWKGQLYFITDRDGTMNLWSMNTNGADLKQLTKHHGWDIKWASLSEGRIAYASGADLRLYEISGKRDSLIPVTLASDLDQEREKWVKTPMEYLTAAHISPDGSHLALTARGQVFVAPFNEGRFVTATRKNNVRYREAHFLPDGKSLLALSDESGEMEFEKIPANGTGQPESLTSGGKIFRMEGLPSPDGKWIACQDKNHELWIFGVTEKTNRRVAISKNSGFSNAEWSPDSKWLAYSTEGDNLYERIFLYHLKDATTTPLTSDRVNSSSPAWSPDGKWIYFLSERNLRSVVGSPWGSRQPEPYFTDTVKIYHVSLRKDGRSPFEPDNELYPEKEKEKPKSEEAEKPAKTKKKNKPAAEKAKPEASQPKPDAEKSKPDAAKTNSVASTAEKPAPAKNDEESKPVKKTTVDGIDLEGIQSRALLVSPVAPGNYSGLAVTDKRLFWVSRGTKLTSLFMLDINKDDPKPKVFSEDVRDYELSANGQKMFIRRGDDFFRVNADSGAPAGLDKKFDLHGWTFPLNPREEWRHMFVESWRLMRDYFYDTNMHGVNWPAILAKYQPLAARVTDRSELSDLIADMVGELSALHIFVTGGDTRGGQDQIFPAALGAAMSQTRDGWRIDRIYEGDPDYPEKCSPLARPGLKLAPGDLIQSINGVPIASVPNPKTLLRNQADRQVLLSIMPATGKTNREVIVTPQTAQQETELRYGDWEYSRRKVVEQLGGGDIGYVHLRAMGADDMAAWARDYYPVFNRQGLIIDVRHNRGGNIDSWILEKLLRKAWFYWQPRVGNPVWSMQYAFRGHIVVLCDERTASDGEAFTDGFKRLGLGKVIGTRTWGGEIWLSFDNYLVDKGIASAAETGVYGPEGKWLIEGHGADPDTVVDNLPHATFLGEDAQLKAAITYLQEQIKTNPAPVPPAPPHPNKAFK